MGLYNLLTTSASGMAAQSTLLNTVADNIANVNTIGYKRSSTEFESLVLDTGVTDYQSGSVLATPRVSIDGQGAINASSSATDLAIQGNGYFVVEGPGSSQPVLTRAGSFVKDKNGNLVNAGGYTLLGYQAGQPNVANGFAGFTGLVPVNLDNIALSATPSTSGKLYLNVPATSTPVTDATALPSANQPSATPTAKTSIVAYDNLGSQVTLDVYLTNTGADAQGNDGWEVAVFNAADATNGTFPYSSGPMATATLAFDPATGSLTTNSPKSLNIQIPNGSQMTLDMSQTTQLATSYTVLTASTNGSAPSQVSSVSVASDGSLSVLYQNGSAVKAYTIPLANVPAPDNMTLVSGNAFQPSLTSGAAQIATAGSWGLGSIQSNALEASTVDLASELTTMIAAQNNYQANSKVFTTGSQLLQVLINLGH